MGNAAPGSRECRSLHRQQGCFPWLKTALVHPENRCSWTHRTFTRKASACNPARATATQAEISKHTALCSILRRVAREEETSRACAFQGFLMDDEASPLASLDQEESSSLDGRLLQAPQPRVFLRTSCPALFPYLAAEQEARTVWRPFHAVSAELTSFIRLQDLCWHVFWYHLRRTPASAPEVVSGCTRGCYPVSWCFRSE